MRHVRVGLALIAAMVAPEAAASQTLPDGPLTFADGRVVVSGEVTATTSTVNAADEGWFNYSSYEHSTLRNIRVALSAQARITRRLSLVGEVRTDHFEALRPYAAFVRVRPWAGRAFDIHVGRVPPTFGAFARRPYSADNLVIGVPLAYQYLTSLRPDALPARTSDLTRMRARGWAASYPVGAAGAAPGLPLANALRWDTGVQARAEVGRVVWLGSVTTGTVSNPRVADDNAAPQFAGRVVVTPVAAVTVGASVARGPWLSDDLAPRLPQGRAPERYAQRAVGADIEVSRGRWLARAEAMRSSWDVPALSNPEVPSPLTAWAALVEGRLRLAPGVDLSGRVERLSFSHVTTAAGSRLTWDAPVDRAEIAVGWRPRRRVTLKASWQINDREGGLVRQRRLGALQCIVSF